MMLTTKTVYNPGSHIADLTLPSGKLRGYPHLCPRLQDSVLICIIELQVSDPLVNSLFDVEWNMRQIMRRDNWYR